MTSRHHSSSGFFILFSFLAAIILTLLPMPNWAIWLRPAWVLLVLIYWALEAPYLINVGTAWLIGIVLDVLNGTLLGEHALAFTAVIYIVARIQSRVRMFSLLQQCLIIFLLILLYQLIIYCVQGFVGNSPHGWLFWLSSFTSVLLWPWLYSIMHDCRRHMKVT